MKPKRDLVKDNLSTARENWPERVTKSHRLQLESLTRCFRFSIIFGDLLLFDSGWYVTHTGLVRLARRNRCSGIHVESVSDFSDPAIMRWAFKATVYKSPKCRGFVGYGDADPSNVSALVRGAEMRVAETRAVNRALRKAYGIGICSVEEIGAAADSSQPARQIKKIPPQTTNGKGFGSPRYCAIDCVS